MAFGLRALKRVLDFNSSDASGTVKVGAPNAAWQYATDDLAATVETAGYFNLAGAGLTAAPGNNSLKVGDTIRAVMAISGTPVFKDYVVTAVPAVNSNVTIALQTTSGG